MYTSHFKFKYANKCLINKIHSYLDVVLSHPVPMLGYTSKYKQNQNTFLDCLVVKSSALEIEMCNHIKPHINACPNDEPSLITAGQSKSFLRRHP